MTASLSVTIAWSRTLNVNRSLQGFRFVSEIQTSISVVRLQYHWSENDKMKGLNTNNLMFAKYVHRLHVMENTPVTMLRSDEELYSRVQRKLDEILLEVNHITETHERNSVMERWWVLGCSLMSMRFDGNFTIELKVREIDVFGCTPIWDRRLEEIILDVPTHNSILVIDWSPTNQVKSIWLLRCRFVYSVKLRWWYFATVPFINHLLLFMCRIIKRYATSWHCRCFWILMFCPIPFSMKRCRTLCSWNQIVWMMNHSSYGSHAELHCQQSTCRPKFCLCLIA